MTKRNKKIWGMNSIYKALFFVLIAGIYYYNVILKYRFHSVGDTGLIIIFLILPLFILYIFACVLGWALEGAAKTKK